MRAASSVFAGFPRGDLECLREVADGFREVALLRQRRRGAASKHFRRGRPGQFFSARREEQGIAPHRPVASGCVGKDPRKQPQRIGRDWLGVESRGHENGHCLIRAAGLPTTSGAEEGRILPIWDSASRLPRGRAGRFGFAVDHQHAAVKRVRLGAAGIQCSVLRPRTSSPRRVAHAIAESSPSTETRVELVGSFSGDGEAFGGPVPFSWSA